MPMSSENYAQTSTTSDSTHNVIVVIWGVEFTRSFSQSYWTGLRVEVDLEMDE